MASTWSTSHATDGHSHQGSTTEEDLDALDHATFLARQAGALREERAVYSHQAEALKAEADSLAQEAEPGDIQFDEESGEGGTLTVDRERDLALSAQARAAVEEIDQALAKIEAGTYGICEDCHQPIPRARLAALPFARLCVACKSGGLFAALTMAYSRSRVISTWISAACVVGADQLTKSLALAWLGGAPVHLLGPFSLSLQLNSGFAFSLDRGHGTTVTVVVVAVVVALAVAATRVRSRLPAISLGLVIGGALGNLVDRLVRHHGGAVVDFLASSFWPTFNLADVAIVVGCALLGISWMRH